MNNCNTKILTCDPAYPLESWRWSFCMHPLHKLETDPRILELLQDDGFAKEFYAAACNADWTHESGYVENATWRGNGGWVAELRGRGENYLDFYCSGGEGTITPRVEAELERLGWTWSPML